VSGWVTFVSERLAELWLRTGEHVLLTGVSTVAAIALGVPLGVLAARVAWLRGPLTGAVGILQTIPSLAMLVILLALLGRIGAVPAIVALTLYALLPIVRNTLTGIRGVSPAILEAAQGIGATGSQRLWLVEMPLATPVIVAGIRTAAVVGVGIATLSAFIGAGGLGQFINRGLALSNTDLILLGAIPAALLALVVDGSIAAAELGLRRGPARAGGWRATAQKVARPVALAAPLFVVVLGVAAYYGGQAALERSVSTGAGAATVRIGSKNFTEQLILGELMAQLLEGRTNLSVKRRFNLGGTMICHGSLENGEIDIYAEYTGTALTAVLGEPVVTDPEAVYATVRREYEQRFRATWLRRLGFNNTYAITVRKADAERNGWRRVSDLLPAARSLRAGFTAEFSERPDGYPGLRDTYGLAFGEVRDLDPALMYEAIARGQVDVICAFATDGRIAAYELQPLEDDEHFFPPYDAAPVVRTEVLRKHPEVREALAPLAGLLDDATMQRLNYQVDGKKRRPREVVREFLTEEGLLSAQTAR
jgi:osmoprotectant transport system permease protein